MNEQVGGGQRATREVKLDFLSAVLGEFCNFVRCILDEMLGRKLRSNSW